MGEQCGRCWHNHSYPNGMMCNCVCHGFHDYKVTCTSTNPLVTTTSGTSTFSISSNGSTQT